LQADKYKKCYEELKREKIDKNRQKKFKETEQIIRSLMMEKEFKKNGIQKENINIITTRGKVNNEAKDFANPSRINSLSTFGKKWSVISNSQIDEESDAKIMHLLNIINNVLDDFKYPDKLIRYKNQENININLIKNSIVLNTLDRIVTMKITLEKYIKSSIKHKTSAK